MSMTKTSRFPILTCSPWILIDYDCYHWCWMEWMRSGCVYALGFVYWNSVMFTPWAASYMYENLQFYLEEQKGNNYWSPLAYKHPNLNLPSNSLRKLKMKNWNNWHKCKHVKAYNNIGWCLYMPLNLELGIGHTNRFLSPTWDINTKRNLKS